MRKIFLLVLCIPLFAAAQTKQITLDDIYKKGTFRSENVPGFNSLKDGRYYTELDNNGNLIKKSFATGETAGTLISKGDIKDEKGNALELKDFEWSDDESKLLVFLNREFIYRRSSKAIVYAYDIATKKTTKVDADKIMHATYSPDGSKIAFVKENNLYYKNLSTPSVFTISKFPLVNNFSSLPSNDSR